MVVAPLAARIISLSPLAWERVGVRGIQGLALTI